MANKIGIDFGTSFCTASWINPSTKKPEAVIFHETGMQKMPSVVYYAPEGTVVGLAAYNQVENTTGMQEEQRNLILSRVVTSIKRKMKKGERFFLPDGKTIRHEEVVAEILSKIRREVSSTCFNNKEIDEVVITHPVVFASWQKEMLVEAAKISKFKKVSLVEEPVAAAIGYASTTNDNSKGILVYDFGGGTFDVAFVQCDSSGVYRVPIEPEGDAFCGGDDIDGLLYDKWEQIAQQKHSRTICANTAHFDIGFMMRCRKHKESMTLMPNNSFSEVLPPPGFHRVEMQLTRADFDKTIVDVIERTISRTSRLLNRIKEGGYKIDTAIMIGGSSRIPLIYDRLKEILPIEPKKVMQVDVAVALGAVLHSEQGNRVAHRNVFCIHCGNKITTVDRFCTKCGKKNDSYINKP